MIDIRKTLKERQETHGNFEIHSDIAQNIKKMMFPVRGDGDLHPYEKEALDMIAHKIARICAGDPHHEDHWRDIAGYATLVADINRGE